MLDSSHWVGGVDVYAGKGIKGSRGLGVAESQGWLWLGDI
jgi:hypothetical protein